MDVAGEELLPNGTIQEEGTVFGEDHPQASAEDADCEDVEEAEGTAVDKVAFLKRERIGSV